MNLSYTALPSPGTIISRTLPGLMAYILFISLTRLGSDSIRRLYSAGLLLRRANNSKVSFSFSWSIEGLSSIILVLSCSSGLTLVEQKQTVGKPLIITFFVLIPCFALLSVILYFSSFLSWLSIGLNFSINWKCCMSMNIKILFSKLQVITFFSASHVLFALS